MRQKQQSMRRKKTKSKMMFLNKLLQKINLPTDLNPSELSRDELFKTAIELREDGKFEKAIDLLKKEIPNYTTDSSLLALLSHCYILNGELEKATNQINKAKEVDPNNALVGWNEARLLLKSENISGSLAVARNTNKRFPNDVEGMGVLGACLRANGDHEGKSCLSQQGN